MHPEDEFQIKLAVSLMKFLSNFNRVVRSVVVPYYVEEMFICRKYIGQSTSTTYKTLAIIRRMSVESNSKSNRIAICHMRSTNDTEKNRSQVTEIVQKAKDMNANVRKETN